MAYSYTAALGLNASNVANAAAGATEFIGPDGSINIPGITSQGIDLSDPKIYKAAETAVKKAIDSMNLDVSALVPGGGTAPGFDRSDLGPIIQSAISGDIGGVARKLLTYGATAACVAGTQGLATPVCGTVVAVLTPVFAEISASVDDGVRSMLGWSTASERAARARAAEVAREVGLFFDALDKALRGLETTEAAIFEQTKASAAAAFASAMKMRLPTSAKQILVQLLRDRLGQTADSAFDPNDPSGMTIADYANITAGQQNLEFVNKSAKGKEFRDFIARTVAPLGDARYKFNTEVPREAWWRNMPADAISVRGKNPIPLNYPTRGADGRSYQPRCRMPAGDMVQPAILCGFGPLCPAGWTFTASDSYIPVNYHARNALLADTRWSPNNSDAATSIANDWNNRWSISGRVETAAAKAMSELMPQVLAKQFDRVLCMIQAHQRTYAALCQRSLGDMLKLIVRKQAMSALQAARARSTKYKQTSGKQFGAIVALAGIGVAGFIVWRARKGR